MSQVLCCCTKGSLGSTEKLYWKWIGKRYTEMSGSGDEANMEAVEVLKEEVLGKLRQVDVAFLTELCTESNVTIPPKKAKMKSGLINLMVMFLSSSTIEDSEDFGAQVLGELRDKLDVHLATGTGDPVKVEQGQQGQQVQGKKPLTNVNKTVQESFVEID